MARVPSIRDLSGVMILGEHGKDDRRKPCGDNEYGLFGRDRRFTLHDLRRKWNDDFGRASASIREQMAACGHASPSVNIAHYQVADSSRMRSLVMKNALLGAIA